MGFDTHLQGCIAPYMRNGFLRNSSHAMQRAGLLSRSAVTLLMTWADSKPFTLTIEE